ncbi:hypothetical protein [Salinimonas sediminis]|uniref:Uncharacterized protein n=1 Tax=Salinimonas sediminis TaxID=2303538 RepID=A0A346NL21_9ALTE|nr:hypothetical protein [Salinimonas sediminis]AXR06228.1 hypothetical protein D0Y50_07525 [Salinimonas sediminis]
MRIAAPDDFVAVPDDYESCDVVSINYRYFSMWLRADLVASLEGVVTEVQFPWSSHISSDNFISRLNKLPEYALQAMALLQSTLQAKNCRIICCEADKFRCSLALVAPLPQVVYQGLQSMPCPDIFELPQMENIDMSPTDYINDHRQRYEH